MNLKTIAQQLNSTLEARMLVKHVTGLCDADLIGLDDIPLEESQEKELENFIAQRLKGRPISKIIGKKEFYGRDFIVNDDVLDPRPDSELIIDLALEHYTDESIRILDMGTGSGCLILTLLFELPKATGVATDISKQAMAVARRNADELGVGDRVEIVESNWFENVEGQFDLIISNPPYIQSEVIATLDKNVREYDPILALDGGEDGLNPYKVILPQIRTFLKPGGIIMMEHGYDQGVMLQRLGTDAGLSNVEIHQDLGGHDRVFTAIQK